MKAIYKMEVDCGRMGSLSGIFIADTEEVKALIETKVEIYFGEVLGKHSEIFGTINEDEIVLVTDDITIVDIFEKYGMATGHNPFEHLDEDWLDNINEYDRSDIEDKDEN